MSYRLEEYEFEEISEYIAAKRDREKIRSLTDEGKSRAQIARNKKKQIAERGIVFETVLGEDFLEQLDAESFTRTEQLPLIDEEAAPSRLKKATKKANPLKRLLLIPLYLLLFFLLAVAGLWLVREDQSRTSMSTLQQRVAVTPTPIQEETVSVTQPEESVQQSVPIEEAVVAERKIQERFADLAAENPDLAGWLTIPDTVVDYPVMYRQEDNDFYLSHNFEGESDVNGLLVLDKRCEPDGGGNNFLIHGHHMRSGLMFGSLKDFTDPQYCREHSVIIYNTLYEEIRFEIFAVFTSTVYDEDTEDFAFYNYIQIGDKESFDQYVDNAKARSLFDTGLDAVWGERLITLSTCEYSHENGRLVVVGREFR